METCILCTTDIYINLFLYMSYNIYRDFIYMCSDIYIYER